jgi:omega-hydroxy-beta-dihydromenaquinone-9 sulfotransferase
MPSRQLQLPLGRGNKPVFIVGTGRCGSTVLHHLLSYHPQLAWLSRFCDMRPHDPRTNRWAMRALDLPPRAPFLRKLIYPVEAYRFWDYYSPGFSRPCRDLRSDDVTPGVKARVQRVMAQMLTPKRSRLLVKTTGWPRIGFLNEIYPEARFVHIYRDGRAVANSWLAVPWWSGWHGPVDWQWEEQGASYLEKWESSGRSFVALAAMQWERLMSAYEDAKQVMAADALLEMRYEDLCQDPVAAIEKAARFCELAWPSGFETLVHRFPFRNRNDRWREDLSDAQQRTLSTVLSESLRTYGYA